MQNKLKKEKDKNPYNFVSSVSSTLLSDEYDDGDDDEIP